MSFFWWKFDIFLFFLVFCCSIFWMVFSNGFQENISNPPAVQPSVFWEKRVTFQKKPFFFNCSSSRCFFHLFDISVDFRVLLGDALAENGLILALFWKDLGSTWDDHLRICWKLLVTCLEFVWNDVGPLSSSPRSTGEQPPRSAHPLNHTTK